MLKEMEKGNIFSVDFSCDKKNIEFTECCDWYYSKLLDKQQLLKLIAELKAFADQMVE